MSLFDKLNDIYKTSTKIIPIITPIRFYSTDTFYSTTIYSSAKLDYTTPVANEVYDILKIILMIAGVCLILSLIFKLVFASFSAYLRGAGTLTGPLQLQ